MSTTLLRKLLSIPLAVILMLGAVAFSWAGPPTDQLRAYTDQVLKILQDVSETAKRALGQHWQQRTAAERDEFVQLFANLLEQTYISRIGEFGGERITYVGEQIDGDRATVRARIVTSKGTEVPVESRLLKSQDRWLIYDVLIANMSLISNYRTQFDRVIRTSSYQDLVQRLRTRGELLNEKESSAPGGSAPGKR